MSALCVIALIVGAIAAAISGNAIVGLVVGGIFFVGGLPFAIVTDFVTGVVEHKESRADRRRLLDALDEDERTDRMVQAIRRGGKRVINDNRQVHLHTHGISGRLK
jgi:hypothetical protein